jgi:putative transposase
MGKQGQKLRQYSAEERQQAVARASEVGNAAAAREMGLPSGTLSCWAFLARKAAAGVAVKAPPGLAVSQPTATSSGSAAARSEPETEATAAPTGTAAAELTSATAPQATTPASRVARVYTPSQRAQAVESAAKIGVGRAARQLGMSRFAIQDWRRKARLHAQGKAETSPVVGPDPPAAGERERRILEVWRAHPGLGPSQVRNQLRRAGFKVSVHTVRVVLDENGYVPPKVRRDPVEEGKRYEAVRPHQLWHVDFLHRHIQKQAVYLLLLLDDFSRFIVGWAVWDAERVDAVIETFERAVARYGRPEMVMSDRGSAFWAWQGTGRFTRLLEEYGVDQLLAKRPQTNGKLEVLNANVQKELFNVERFFDLGETARRLDTWVRFYNFRRTHHALGGLLVPADRQFGRADEVLAVVESGRTPDGIDEPMVVGERTLDLLRVTSQSGAVAVYLMGQRLWPPPPVVR